ncbi:hypothetical protein Droror1_Dr00023464 [Drosera rotundifolia]
MLNVYVLRRLGIVGIGCASSLYEICSGVRNMKASTFAHLLSPTDVICKIAHTFARMISRTPSHDQRLEFKKVEMYKSIGDERLEICGQNEYCSKCHSKSCFFII